MEIYRNKTNGEISLLSSFSFAILRSLPFLCLLRKAENQRYQRSGRQTMFLPKGVKAYALPE